jgi:hypothetical protein
MSVTSGVLWCSRAASLSTVRLLRHRRPVFLPRDEGHAPAVQRDGSVARTTNHSINVLTILMVACFAFSCVLPPRLHHSW